MGSDPVTRQFEKHTRQLQHWSGTPTAAQVAAVQAIENLIVTMQAQEAFARKLRLLALFHLGQFLLLVRRGKGRPRKNVLGEHFSRPTYRQLGITKPHIARDALAIAENVPEGVRYKFLAMEPDLRLTNLFRYARKHGGHKGGFFLMPPERLNSLQARYGEIIDVFPHPRPDGYNALAISWADLKKDKPNAALYVHPPFVKEDYDEGQTLTDVVRKCIEEAGNGVGPIVLVMPTRAAVNLLLEASFDQIEISDMDSWGRPRFGHTEKLETHKSPPAVTFFELNPKPAPVPTIKIVIDLSDVDWDDGEEWIEIPIILPKS
jgi:hypothetical protein